MTGAGATGNTEIEYPVYWGSLSAALQDETGQRGACIIDSSNAISSEVEKALGIYAISKQGTNMCIGRGTTESTSKVFSPEPRTPWVAPTKKMNDVSKLVSSLSSFMEKMTEAHTVSKEPSPMDQAAFAMLAEMQSRRAAEDKAAAAIAELQQQMTVLQQTLLHMCNQMAKKD